MGHNPTQSSPGRVGDTMFGIPRRYSHFVFGTIQAGLTSLIAAGIASTPFGPIFIPLAAFLANLMGRNASNRAVRCACHPHLIDLADGRRADSLKRLPELVQRQVISDRFAVSTLCPLLTQQRLDRCAWDLVPRRALPPVLHPPAFDFRQ
jgi:hypothetical protein